MKTKYTISSKTKKQIDALLDKLEVKSIRDYKMFLENVSSADLKEELFRFLCNENYFEKTFETFYSALAFLKENVNECLTEAFEYASECGYTLENINTSILAQIVYERHKIEDYEELFDDFVTGKVKVKF